MKQNLSRRRFLQTLGMGTAAFGAPQLIRAAVTRYHVVVVGGGFAGATAAKYLKHWSTDVDVTLVEPNGNYYSPILSNLILNQQMNLNQITFDYQTLIRKYAVQVVQDRVTEIDAEAFTLRLAGGGSLSYDRLVLAPGISFKNVPGLDSDKIPHAWKSGAQVQLLQQQLAAMPDNGVFVMTIPAAPYRCPPGPYERACVVADYLQRNKPNARIRVLDANADIIVEKEIFQHAFDVTYGDILTYQTNVQMQAVDSDAKRLTTNQGEYSADVLNVIPNQQAGDLIRDAGLNNDASNDWAAVDPLSYESTLRQGIHIIGDSQGTGQPKAGHIGNAEAKICADAVLRILHGQTPYANPVTNSACYSPISANTASWLTAVFAYDANTASMQLVNGSLGAANAATRRNYRAMFDWSNNLFADTFA